MTCFSGYIKFAIVFCYCLVSLNGGSCCNMNNVDEEGELKIHDTKQGKKNPKYQRLCDIENNKKFCLESDKSKYCMSADYYLDSGKNLLFNIGHKVFILGDETNKDFVEEITKRIELVERDYRGDGRDVYRLKDYNGLFEIKCSCGNFDIIVEDDHYTYYFYIQISSHAQIVVNFTSKFSELVEDYSKFYAEVNVYNVNILKIDKATSFSGCYYNCKNLQSLNIDTLNPENIVYLSRMFHGCENIEKIDLSHLTKNSKLTKLKNIDYMFSECKNLRELILFDFDGTSINNCERCFQSCSNLKEINLSQFSFNRFSIDNVYKMFDNTLVELVEKLEGESISCVTVEHKRPVCFEKIIIDDWKRFLEKDKKQVIEFFVYLLKSNSNLKIEIKQGKEFIYDIMDEEYRSRITN